jgi:hypothetical protein
MSVVSLPSETFKLKDQVKTSVFMYLPNEGLQGENIPSYMLWKNAKAEYIQVSFMKFDDIFRELS